MYLDDTIAAIASPPGCSQRGMIRISGRHAFALLNDLISSTDRLSDSSIDPLPCGAAPLFPRRGLYRARARHPDGLPLLIACFCAPSSYTGEDIAELFIPGHPCLLTAVLDEMIRLGARHAQPGEFSARAYFNGRMTLTQAEGVAASIAAVSDAQMRAAGLLRAGRLGATADDLSAQIAHCLALVEAGIDFTDQEGVIPITARELLERAHQLKSQIDAILSRSVGRQRLSDLPSVVLVGPPNAGKSSLFNALLSRRRVVVSDVAGTTRDVIAEPLKLGSSDDPEAPEVMLVDLAGLSDPGSSGVSAVPSAPVPTCNIAALNPLMQRAAHEAIAAGDLLIILEPCAAAPDAAPIQTGGAACAAVTAAASVREAIRAGVPVIHVRSKCDLASDPSGINVCRNDSAVLAVSAKTGVGLDELRRALRRTLSVRLESLSGQAISLEARHDHALRLASQHLHHVIKSLREGRGRQQAAEMETLPDAEITAADLRAALDALGLLTGSSMTPDDLLGQIFANFCIGK